MLFVYTVLCLLPLAKALSIPLPKIEDEAPLNCVLAILKKHFDGVSVTYVDLEYDDDSILKAISRKHVISLTIRHSYSDRTHFNEGYLIVTKNVQAFIKNFVGIVVKEPQWNPTARFLVVVKDLDTSELRDLFNQFLRFHVLNIHVLHESFQELYTYNPFADYGCGKRYKEIINNGNCAKEVIEALYPGKLNTGLRNCTLNVLASSDGMPFSNDPTSHPRVKRKGVEQIVLEIFAKLDNFKINYIYIDYDIFPEVYNNMTATGSLHRIQMNDVDIQLGGMVLSPNRATAFDYVSTHLPHVDMIVILVKKTQNVDMFRNMCEEFGPVVWILFLITYVLYFLITAYVFKVRDKVGFALKLLDAMFLHSYNNYRKLDIRLLYICWIWFGYLMNTFYQSSLTSFSMRPLREYQVSNEQDLDKFNYKSCVSKTVASLIAVASAVPFFEHEPFPGDCSSMLDSMRVVSKNKNVYTLNFFSLYVYHVDELSIDGVFDDSIYLFNQPLFRLIYGIYLYKGFPFTNKWNVYGLRLQENGLISKFGTDIFRSKTWLIHQDKPNKISIVPWQVFEYGCGMAIISFLLELIISYKDRLWRRN